LLSLKVTHLHHPPSFYFLCLFSCCSRLMIRQRKCGVNNSRDLQLVNNHRNNSSNSSACRNNKWAFLHVDGEGWKLTWLMWCYYPCLVVTLTLGLRLYIVRKIFLRATRYCLCTLKTDLIWKRYECPKFWDIKSPSFESLKEKWHLDVVPMERHKI
jgi:hypothetical protein